MFSVGGDTGRLAHEVSLECAPIVGGSYATAFEGQMPRPSKVVPNYSLLDCLAAVSFNEWLCLQKTGSLSSILLMEFINC